MPSRNILCYGREEPLPERIPLRAGPLSMFFESGDLRYVRAGGREISRRIYVAVRDRNWGTVPAEISNFSLQREADSFAVAFVVDNRQDDIHFRWTARITGSAEGVVSWTMEGEALTTFLRNRIGFCVLHPLRECAGRPCTVEKADGSFEKSAFPRLAAPHQPFIAMRAISYEVEPGVTAEVRFAGDIFETEDQRNWTDASFKTYSTPLALPFPVEVRAGSRISQSVQVSLHGKPASTAEAVSGLVVFSVGTRRKPLPAIGLCGPVDGCDPERLRALNLAHIRVDAESAGAAELPLEVAVCLTGDAEAQLSEIAERARSQNWKIARWLIFHTDEKSTNAKWVALARRYLGGFGAPLLAGTDAYFAELNRVRPDPAVIDGACFALNPQVHAFDNATMVENAAAQADAVESALQFLDGKPVSVTPVTLKPRFNPDATAAGPQTPPDSDPRQKSLFGAGWTVGSLKYLAQGGASSVTYYEACGDRGVMDGNVVFPVYHVFADVGDRSGGESVDSESSDPLACDGIVVSREGRTRAIVANFTAGMRRVRLVVPGKSGPCRVKQLDENTAERAMHCPEDFRNEPGELRIFEDGGVEIELAPFAVARIDYLEKS